MDASDPKSISPGGVRTTRHRGRMTDARRAQLAELLPSWSVADWSNADEIDRSFGRSGPLWVDIGVGHGEATRAWAAERPDANVIAVELHRPGVAQLLGGLDADGPANVRVIMADACTVLAELALGTVTEIRTLFPDPWPKRRHVGRRLVDRTFAVAAAEALEIGGTLHLATDWADYAEHMRTMIATEPRFEPLPDGPPTGGWSSARPARPITTYEQRGLDAGRTVTDLRWTRTAQVG